MRWRTSEAAGLAWWWHHKALSERFKRGEDHLGHGNWSNLIWVGLMNFTGWPCCWPLMSLGLVYIE
jgi:hypothetical protein